MKSLIVTYTPRGERSNTKKLVDHAVSVLDDPEVLDLVEVVPDFFLPGNLSAYMKRNYGGEKLDDSEKSAMAKMDKMTEQVKSADVIVLAYPMYNFSFPAIVKAWFDSVMQKGETWDIADSGYVGLLKDKKALILTTSGGKYSGDMSGYDHSIPLGTQEFGFMGFTDVKSVHAGGMNADPDNAPAEIESAKKKISDILTEWKS